MVVTHFVAEVIPALATGSFIRLASIPFGISLFFLNISLLFGITRCCRLILYFPWSILEPTTSPSIQFLWCGNGFRNQDVDATCTYCVLFVIASWCFHWTELENVCMILTHLSASLRGIASEPLLPRPWCGAAVEHVRDPEGPSTPHSTAPESARD